MTLIKYIDKTFKADSLAVIDQANSVLDEYKAQGYVLSLRQLYYQFVARDKIENTERSYKRLGTIINDARLAGLVSWLAIEDRGRSCSTPYFQPEVDRLFAHFELGYSIDPWVDQPCYIEVWVEKDALSNIVAGPCDKWSVAYMACKGYLSASEAWRAGQRFKRARAKGKDCHLIHLGDHDPSGLDMTRDNVDRLTLFGVEGSVHRIALNMDQVRTFSPPPNPAKITDTRAAEYISKYGPTSWELDALEPSFLADLVDRKLASLIDLAKWDASMAEQKRVRADLSSVSKYPDEILQLVRDLEDKK